MDWREQLNKVGPPKTPTPKRPIPFKQGGGWTTGLAVGGAAIGAGLLLSKLVNMYKNSAYRKELASHGVALEEAGKGKWYVSSLDGKRNYAQLVQFFAERAGGDPAAWKEFLIPKPGAFALYIEGFDPKYLVPLMSRRGFECSAHDDVLVVKGKQRKAAIAMANSIAFAFGHSNQAHAFGIMDAVDSVAGVARKAGKMVGWTDKRDTGRSVATRAMIGGAAGAISGGPVGAVTGALAGGAGGLLRNALHRHRMDKLKKRASQGNFHTMSESEVEGHANTIRNMSEAERSAAHASGGNSYRDLQHHVTNKTAKERQYERDNKGRFS